MDGDGFTREVSIIIPVFNEEENINPMIQEIQEAMEDADYEILFVDDGSNDRTFEMITQAKSKEDKVRVVKHHRNMGKAIALATGFFHASGRISITMDGDLQDDPKEILDLLPHLKMDSILSAVGELSDRITLRRGGHQKSTTRSFVECQASTSMT